MSFWVHSIVSSLQLAYNMTDFRGADKNKLYIILDVAKNADDATLKKAYRKLAMVTISLSHLTPVQNTNYD